MPEELTTVQIDVGTREILRGLAEEDLRSMAAELKFLVNQEKTMRTQRVSITDQGRAALAQAKEDRDAHMDESPQR